VVKKRFVLSWITSAEKGKTTATMSSKEKMTISPTEQEKAKRWRAKGDRPEVYTSFRTEQQKKEQGTDEKRKKKTPF